MTDKDVKRLYKELVSIIEEEESYFQPDLRGEKRNLANQLRIGTNEIEQIINKVHGKTFAQLMYEYRIETAKKLLSDPNHEKKKIAEIAYDIGFGNLWDFNMYFKELVDVNPTEYRAFHLNFKKVMGMTPLEYESQ